MDEEAASYCKRIRVAEFEGTSQPWTHVVEDSIRALKYYGATGLRAAKARTAATQEDLRPILVTVMGINDGGRLTPYQGMPLIPICWDVWEPDWPKWDALIYGHNVVALLVSNSQVQSHFRQSFPTIPTLFFSEAIDVENFEITAPLRDRPIDVLEFGRRNDLWHDKFIRQSEGSLNHVYSGQPSTELRQDLYKSRYDLATALGLSTISICFTRKVTAPDQTGCVSSLTPRYLESLAAGAIVLGNRPEDLGTLREDLFMLEADLADPFGQVSDILANIPSYERLTHTNQNLMLVHGGWKVRALEIARELSAVL